MKLNKSFTKMFVMVTWFLIIPGLILLAADKADKRAQWPVIKKGAEVMRVQGVLRNMRDANNIPLSQRLTPRKMKPVLNLDRGLPIIKKETRPDTAAQDFNRSSKTASLEPPRQMAVPIWYAAQASIDSLSNPGVLTLGEETIITGTGYQSTYDRWGDYTHMTIDPVDDQVFWYTNEYYITSGTNWQTRIAAFKLKPDLWSQDRPNDTGVEPNTVSYPMWCSEDIWGRNQPDGYTNQTHQNPEFGQTNYLYVKIRCRDGEGHGIDKVYWSWAGSGLAWPGTWTQIGEQPTGTISEGNFAILEFPWLPPDPSAYGSAHFCLLSRIETAPFPPYGMTFPEVPAIGTNVANNNNIVWKNVTIVNNIPNGGSGGGAVIIVGNLTEATAQVRLVFQALPAGEVEAIQAQPENILDWGTVQVNLGKELFARWQTDAKGAGTGVIADKDSDTTITVLQEKAYIEDLLLKPGEEQPIKVIFTPFKESAADKKDYTFDVIQFHFDGRKWVEIGGVRFIVKPPIDAAPTSISRQ